MAQGFGELGASLLALESVVRQNSLSRKDSSPKNLPSQRSPHSISARDQCFIEGVRCPYPRACLTLKSCLVNVATTPCLCRCVSTLNPQTNGRSDDRLWESLAGTGAVMSLTKPVCFPSIVGEVGFCCCCLIF